MKKKKQKLSHRRVFVQSATDILAKELCTPTTTTIHYKLETCFALAATGILGF
jgi:hypothetical protein